MALGQLVVGPISCPGIQGLMNLLAYLHAGAIDAKESVPDQRDKTSYGQCSLVEPDSLAR
jgi:hypothetical protein